MISAQFHMTSDYLEEDGKNIDNTDAVYDITDWSSGFDILLYNYEKENLALIAADDIQYDVSITSSGTGGWGCPAGCAPLLPRVPLLPGRGGRPAGPFKPADCRPVNRRIG